MRDVIGMLTRFSDWSSSLAFYGLTFESLCDSRLTDAYYFFCWFLITERTFYLMGEEFSPCTTLED